MSRDETITIYAPDSTSKRGFAGSVALMARNVRDSRELVWQLFKRDFLSGNNQSVLGMLWIFISPVVAIISWVFLNKAGVLKPGDVGVPYPVYVLVGSTIWGLFTSFCVNLSKSLSDSGGLLLQINFPHEALLAKQAAVSLAGMAINILLIAVIMAAYGIMPPAQAVLFPLAVLPLLVFGMAVGTALSVVGAVISDVSRGITSILGFLMFFTPVIYSPKFQDETLQAVVKWNPLAYLVAAPRDMILYGSLSGAGGFALSGVFSLVLFLLALRVFYLSERRVIERV